MKFVSGGCSFSADDFCWPVHTADLLNFEHYQTGVGSAGNDLISRRVLDQLLKFDNYDNVVVGVMWSASTRKSFYTRNPIALEKHKPHHSATSPFKWKPDPWDWLLVNVGFNDKFADGWYKLYADEAHSIIETYEHVLRLQWFLEAHKIKYFFTTFNSYVFKVDKDDKTCVSDNLHKQVNWNKFLPIKGCTEWCQQNCGDLFPDPDDGHPGEQQHKMFAQQVVIPWLQNNDL